MSAFQSQGISGLDGEGSELYLDTLGTCVLCLKGPSGDDGFKDVCLGDICRYLEIDGLKKKSPQEPTSEEANEACESSKKKEEYNFEVTLCETCSIEANQLSELISALEKIQVEVVQRLQNIQRILRKSQERKDECTEQLERIQKHNPIEVRVLEYLREQADKKCSEKLMTLPSTKDSVLLKTELCSRETPPASNPTPVNHTNSSGSQIKTPRVPMTVSVPPSFPSPPGRIARPALPPTAMISSAMNVMRSSSVSLLNPAIKSSSATPRKITRLLPASTGVNLSAPPSSSKLGPSINTSLASPAISSKLKGSSSALNVFQGHYGTKIQNGVEMITCYHCDVVCQKNTNFRMHLVIKHLEVLFSKVPGVSQKTFKEKVMEVMNGEISMTEPSVLGEKIWQCKVCLRDYLHGKACKYHLIVEHYSILANKLAMLLEDTRTKMGGSRRKLTSIKQEKEKNLSGGDNSSQSSVAGTPRSGKYKCATWSGGCGEKFPNLLTLQKHQSVCRKKRRGEVSTCNVAHGGCGKQFPSKTSLQLHRLHNCPKFSKVGKDDGRRSYRKGHQERTSETSTGNPVKSVPLGGLQNEQGTSRVAQEGYSFMGFGNIVHVEMEEGQLQTIDVEGIDVLNRGGARVD